MSLLTILLLTLAALPCFAEVQDKTVKIGGTSVRYRVVLPNNYDPAKTYPGVLAFAGGGQTWDIVDGMIRRQFQQQAEKRGYIVVSPAAPGGRLFFEGGEKIFPEFFTRILADYKIEGNKFHIAGRSNGGISAFHVAALFPQYLAHRIPRLPDVRDQPAVESNLLGVHLHARRRARFRLAVDHERSNPNCSGRRA